MTNKIELSWKGQMLFESVAPEGNVMIDAAEEVGGQGKGLRPKAMMLSSLAGCSGMAKKKKLLQLMNMSY